MSRNKVFAALIALLVSSAAAAPPVFRFRPPDSITFTLEVKSSHTRSFDTTNYPTDSSITTLRRTLTRSGNRFQMVSQPISIVTKSGGQVADNPINGILEGTQVLSTLDTLGLITSVSGFEHIGARIDSQYTGQLAERLKRSLSVENLSAREQFGWNGILQNLAGRQVDFEKIDYEQSQYPLPGGLHIPLLIAVRLTDTIRLSGKLCGVLRISAGSDPMELAKRIGKTSDEVIVHYPLSDTAGIGVTQAGSRYNSETEAVIEIGTMLPQSESTSREIVVAGSTKSGASVLKMVEGEARRYDYRK